MYRAGHGYITDLLVCTTYGGGGFMGLFEAAAGRYISNNPHIHYKAGGRLLDTSRKNILAFTKKLGKNFCCCHLFLGFDSACRLVGLGCV